jgi:hypothetical protein
MAENTMSSKDRKRAEEFRQKLIDRQQPSVSPTKDEASIIRQSIDRINKLAPEELLELKQAEEDAAMDKNMLRAIDRHTSAEGGPSMLVPPEMEETEEEEMPLDTYTPDEQAMAEQVPDEEMEDDHLDFVLGETLDESEQEYLMNALESDPKLNDIFDKVITSASEFSGAGEVEGPGTGVSDSIPARLSDGEFVVTEEATDEIGADNLQKMMDDAERESERNGGKVRYAGGGLLDDPTDPYGDGRGDPLAEDDDDEEIHRSMLGANQMPSLVGSRR